MCEEKSFLLSHMSLSCGKTRLTCKKKKGVAQMYLTCSTPEEGNNGNAVSIHRFPVGASLIGRQQRLCPWSWLSLPQARGKNLSLFRLLILAQGKKPQFV